MLEEKTAMTSRTDGLVAGREASELLQAALQKLSPELRETVILARSGRVRISGDRSGVECSRGHREIEIEPRAGPSWRGSCGGRRWLFKMMTCAELEILLADYVDGNIHGEEKSAFEASSGGAARSARNWLAMRRARWRSWSARRWCEAPPELVTRILFEITADPAAREVKPSWVRRIFGKWLEPMLQPRYAMGMAMTCLSFAMLGRFSGIEVRQLKPADLDPVKVWMATEDRAHRTWERTVKYYENLRVVFEIQTQAEGMDGAGGCECLRPDAKNK